MSMLTSLGLSVAFLAPAANWNEPAPEPVRRPLGSWVSTAFVGLIVLIVTTPPVAIALYAHQAEAAFRARCETVGGRISLARDARRPYDCARD